LYNNSDESSTIMLWISTASCLATVFILIIVWFSPLLQKKSFIRIVCYTAISDFISSISTSFGELKDGTSICTAQGWLSNIFPLSSVFWSFCAALLLYSNLVTLRPFTLTPIVHCICWGFPILISSLIYSSNRIGEPQGKGWCFIASRSESPGWSLLFWTVMSFYLWILLATIGILVCIYRVIAQLHKTNMARSRMTSNISGNNATQVNVLSVYLSPVVVVFCWCLPCYTDISTANDLDVIPRNSIIYKLSVTLPLLQGLITAVIFCTSTRYIRRLFWKVLKYRGGYHSFGLRRVSLPSLPLKAMHVVIRSRSIVSALGSPIKAMTEKSYPLSAPDMSLRQKHPPKIRGLNYKVSVSIEDIETNAHNMRRSQDKVHSFTD